MIQVILDDLQQLQDRLRRLVFSDRSDKTYLYEKICVRPFEKKGETLFQLEQFKGPQVFHQNLSFNELLHWVQTVGAKQYRQLLLTAAGTDIQYTIRGDRVRRKARENNLAAPAVRAHNREKQYLLREGENIPALVDLGVFTKDFRIVKAKYDKYKQINRFVELIDDAFQKSGRKQITILDFGCGKSYLTFIVYYYFTVLRGIKATVLGFDLKEDVVAHCNAVAARYGYDDLQFYVNDVTTDKLFEGKVDMVITLHACDVATDYALLHAIRHKVPYLFSVPCCQHEVNGQIRPGGEFDLLLGDGLFKERFSALLTDAVRAEALRQCGYKVDVLEFVDLAHSPKNLMLRCFLQQSKTPDLTSVRALLKQYGVRQTLIEALENEELRIKNEEL